MLIAFFLFNLLFRFLSLFDWYIHISLFLLFHQEKSLFTYWRTFMVCVCVCLRAYCVFLVFFLSQGKTLSTTYVSMLTEQRCCVTWLTLVLCWWLLKSQTLSSACLISCKYFWILFFFFFLSIRMDRKACESDISIKWQCLGVEWLLGFIFINSFNKRMSKFLN